MPLCFWESRFPNSGLFLVEKARLSKYMSSCFVGTRASLCYSLMEMGVLLGPELVM